MNSKIVRYLALEEAKANSKSNKKKKVGVGGGMKQVCMRQFPSTAYWKVLQPESDVVSEPANPLFKVSRAPTITEVEAKYVPQKYKFSQRFAVPKFESVQTEPDLDQRGNPKKDTTTGKPIQITTPREKGCINAAFKRKYKLSATSMPWEVAYEFTPFSDGNGKKCITKDAFSFELLTEWTTNKAHMAGAGKKVYKGEWVIFSARELRQHFGIYLLQGLAPSPRIEYKFNPQCRDRIAGNDFVYNSFGSNAKCRDKHFKVFLACCNPMIKSPSKEEFPY